MVPAFNCGSLNDAQPIIPPGRLRRPVNSNVRHRMRKNGRWATGRVAGETDAAMPVKIYPRPDYRSFLHGFIGMAVCLVVIHWIPDLAIWIHAHFFGEKLVIDERALKFKLVVAYVGFGIATAIGLAGLAWAAWHLPTRETVEAARKAQLDKAIDIEVAERLRETERRESQSNV